MQWYFIVLIVLAGLFILPFLLFITTCVFFSLFVDGKKEYDKHSGFYRFLLNVYTFIVLKYCRVKIIVSGKEKMPKGRYLLVSNHLSSFDPIVTWMAFYKDRLAFISKPSNMKIPVFSKIVRRCCFLSINREDPKEAIKSIIKASELIKNDQASIGVYPEGTRSKTGELLPFHNGVFKIAQKAQVPIVVLKTSNTKDVSKNLLRRTTKVYLDVLDVLPYEEIKDMGTQEIGDKVVKLLKNNLE